MLNLSLTLTASLIILSLLIPAIQALLGKRNIYEDDKKQVDKYHSIRKAKVQCKSSSSKCKTAIPVDKDEDLIFVDHIISSSATTYSSNSDSTERSVGKDEDFIIVDPTNSLSIATSHPWSALRLLRAAVSPSGSEYLELELGGPLNSTWQLGNTSLYLSFFSDSVFVVPTLLAAPTTFGDVVSAVGWTRDVFIYRVLLTEGGNYRLCVKLEWLDWPSIKSCRLTSTPQATSTCHPVSIDRDALLMDSSKQYRVVRSDHSQAAEIQKLHVPLSGTSPVAVADEGRVAESCEGGVAACTFCSSSQAFHGRLLLASTPPMNSTNLANDNSSLIAGAVELNVLSNGTKVSTTGTTFAPYGCRTLPFIGKHEYARRHYLFLGDSTLQVVFKGVVEQLFGEGSYRSHNNASPFREVMEQLKMGPAYTMRWFDLVVQLRNNRTTLYTQSDHKKRNVSNPSSSAGTGYEDYSDPRMTFMFNGGSLPHLNKKGAALTGFPWDSSDLYHRELRRIVGESFQRCLPVVVFFNTGLHDLFNPQFSFDRYRVGLNRSMLQLKQLVLSELEQRTGNRPCHLSSPVKWYWVTTAPLFKLYICANYGRHGVELINAIADELAEEHQFEVSYDEELTNCLYPIKLTYSRRMQLV